MQRRDFLRRTVTGIGASWLTTKLRATPLPASDQPLPRKYTAHDDVVVGSPYRNSKRQVFNSHANARHFASH
jgi:hypothetical protein